MDAVDSIEDLIPVTLLTGFLGSGKTTVLNRLLRQPKLEETAVIVNEFGEVGLDHLLIGRTSSGAVLLNNGCVCCTVRGQLDETLLDLLVQRARGEIPKFRRVIIETTGLADPAPILHLLISDPVVTVRYRMGGVVTTVDAVNGWDTLDRNMEALRQAAVADRLLITKTDLAGAQSSARLRSRLAALNPGARMQDVIAGVVDPARLFDTALYQPESKTLDVQGWLRAEAYEGAGEETHQATEGHEHCGPHGTQSTHGTHGTHDTHDSHETHAHQHHHDKSRHDHGISSFCFIREAPVRWQAFSSWLEMLAAHRGRDLLRVKGIVNIADRPGRPVVIHGVQQIFHPPLPLDEWPDADHRTRIVFIARNLEQAALQKTLQMFEDG